MTRIFDFHADLGWNIERLHKAGEKNILANHHLDNLKKGEVLDRRSPIKQFYVLMA